MKYRSRTDIIAMILQSANNGATKTRIMYGAYLSYAQVKEYMEFLQQKGLLKYETGTGLYTLTETGLHFLRVYNEISDLVTVDENEKSTGMSEGAIQGIKPIEKQLFR